MHIRDTLSPAVRRSGGGLLALILVAGLCTAASAESVVAPPWSESEPANVTISVSDSAGLPVAGAQVFWAQRGFPNIRCGTMPNPRDGYVHAGIAETDGTGTGHVVLPPSHLIGTSEDASVMLLVLGPDGTTQALGSIAHRQRNKDMTLHPNSNLSLTVTCGGEACGRGSARIFMSNDGAQCEQHIGTQGGDGPAQMGLNALPQGEARLRLDFEVGTPGEARLDETRGLDGDMTEVIDLPRVAGPHRLTGTVRFADGSPPGVPDYATHVRLICPHDVRRQDTPDASTGVFVLDALPDGPCTVSASSTVRDGALWGTGPLEVTPSTTDTLDLVLEEGMR